MRSPRPCGDRMAAVDHPDALALARLAPFQAAGRAHQPLEDLREVAGVEDDQPHALPDAPLHALDDCVGDIAMRGVAPPEKHVGLGEPRLGQAVLGLLQRGGRRPRCPGSSLQRAAIVVVHAVGIDFPDLGVLLLVDILAPDKGPDRHSTPPSGYLSASDRPASAASARPPRRAPRRASRSRAAGRFSARRRRRRRRPARRSRRPRPSSGGPAPRHRHPCRAVSCRA